MNIQDIAVSTKWKPQFIFEGQPIFPTRPALYLTLALSIGWLHVGGISPGNTLKGYLGSNKCYRKKGRIAINFDNVRYAVRSTWLKDNKISNPVLSNAVKVYNSNKHMLEMISETNYLN